MKNKIFRIVFLIIFSLGCLFIFVKSGGVETSLLKAFISPKSSEEVQLEKLANLSSTHLNVLFEADTQSDLDELQTEFLNRAQELNLEKNDYSDVVEIYKRYPHNFLTDKVRGLIQDNKFSELETDSLHALYNPMGVYVLPPDEDPYLLVSDYVFDCLQKLGSTEKELDGKFYSAKYFEVSDFDTVHRIIEIQKSLNKAHSGQIYLSGTPVHSAITSARSGVEINLICALATLALIVLCKIYFKTFRIVFPIALSIIFGFLTGYAVSAMVFENLHVLTFVFGTSLIGISLDYSLHYFLTRDEKGFLKSLTSSMLTTVLAFSILYFSDVEILRQIAIFTSCGLVGVYCFVLLFLPLFDTKTETLNFKTFSVSNYKKMILGVIFIVTVLGLLTLKFSDNIKDFYTPEKELLSAEKLYAKVFPNRLNRFILVKGNSVDDILTEEEKITQKLVAQNVNFVALSDFLPSKNRQKENQALVKNLYEADLAHYATFLDKEKIAQLKQEENGAIYEPQNFPLREKFMPDETTSFIALDTPVEIGEYKTVNLVDDISKIIRNSRLRCLSLFPMVFAVLFAFLACIYGGKNSFKILLPPLLGAGFSLAAVNIFAGQVNLFHILALFLIVGFSLDYSIFRFNGGKKSKDAVLISCSSTALSFLLLSFTSFKLISSLGVVLFLGITTSYILSLLLISPAEETETM